MEIPREYNAATWFVDRHVAEGRGGRLAVIHEGGRLTYGDVAAGANRLGNALRRLGVQREQRVMLLLHDSPQFVWSFWGTLKIGAVPIPTNTLLKPRDYEYILRDSRAEVAIASEALAPALAEARLRAPALQHVVVAGRASAAVLQLPDADRTYDLRSVRLCTSAGEPLPKAIYERWLERFGIEILDGIGSTELCHQFIANRPGRVRPGSSGTLVPGYDARI